MFFLFNNSELAAGILIPLAFISFIFSERTYHDCAMHPWQDKHGLSIFQQLNEAYFASDIFLLDILKSKRNCISLDWKRKLSISITKFFKTERKEFN